MPRPHRVCAWLTLAGLVLACAEPTLDPADWERSAEKVRESVDEARRSDFDFALETVRQASRGEIEGTDPFSPAGMTATDVFARAEQVEIHRDLAFVEREIESERQIVDARVFLDRLRIRDFRATPGEGDRVRAELEVVNETGAVIGTAWLRIEARLPDGRVYDGEDIVDFRPGLEPGAREEIAIPISGDARLVLPPGSGTEVSARFTLLERGGEVLAQEPSPETLAAAETRLADAERRRDALRARLTGR